MQHLTPSDALEATKVFEVYFESYSHRLGRQSQTGDKYYLTIVNDQLNLTNDKTQQASSEAISYYINDLINILHSAPIFEKNADLIEAETKLTVIFNKYYSKENDNVFESLVNSIDEHTIPISENNPFYDTDLVVFSNEYKGNLPINGIKEDDFLLISTRINELKETNKTGSLSINKTNPENIHRWERKKNLLIQDITWLCARNTGREIVHFLINSENKVEIDVMTQSPPQVFPGFNIQIGYNPDHKAFLGVYENKTQQITNFIALGHEFIHAVHFIEDLSKAYKRSKNEHLTMYNMEEYATILGWKKVDESHHFDSENKDKLDENFFSNWDEDIKDSSWEKQSENGLRSIFSYPPRINNYYEADVQSLETDQITFIKKAASKDFNFDEELSKFISIGKIEMDEQELINHLLGEACRQNNFEIALELLERGADLDNLIKWKIQQFLIKEFILNPSSLNIAKCTKYEIKIPEVISEKDILEVFYLMDSDSKVEVLNKLKINYTSEKWHSFLEYLIKEQGSLDAILSILTISQNSALPDNILQMLMNRGEELLHIFMQEPYSEVSLLMEGLKSFNSNEQWQDFIQKTLNSFIKIYENREKKDSLEINGLFIFINRLDKDIWTSEAMIKNLENLVKNLINTYLIKEKKGQVQDLTDLKSLFELLPSNNISIDPVFELLNITNLDVFKKYIAFFKSVGIDLSRSISNKYFSIELISALNMRADSYDLDESEGLEWLKAFTDFGYPLYLPGYEKTADLDSLLDGPFLKVAVTNGLVDLDSIFANLPPEYIKIIKEHFRS